jgi:AhpD family alkylhydroperoxidase
MALSGLSKIEKRLISTAAAVAAGCKPCTATTIRHAREVGASEKEIQKAVTIGLEVKRYACDEIQLEALKYFDTVTSGSCTNGSCTIKIPEISKTDWLIATGAAFAVNSTAGFERFSAAAEQLGATADEFKIAVEIARHVKAQASIQVDKIAALVVPIGLREEAVSGRCGCSAESNEISRNGCPA